MADKEELESIDREKERWEQTTLKKALDRSGERSDTDFGTSSTETERLCTPLDIAETDYALDVGFPGEYPYTRGVQPTMYRGRLWSIRQYAGYGTAEESNRRFKFLLSQGQRGLSVTFDLPTQLGYDSDDPMSQGEVGKVGVAIDTLHDMETVFDGIPLDRVSTSMTINAPAAVLVAMYAVVGQKQGVPSAKLQGTAQNDVLKEYVARGTYIYPPRPSLRLAADLMAYCAKETPRFNSISISGYHIRDAGSTAVQEMAFTFANAIAYIDAALDCGLKIDSFAPRISWIFNTQSNFLEEAAKYRALRPMWAKVMREHYGAKDPRSWVFRTHAQTGGATLTAEQPELNIVRTNRSQAEDEGPRVIFKVEPETERAQVAKLQAFKRQRDDAAVQAALKRLKEACRGSENLLYPIVKAVKVYATLGEICGVMCNAFGDYRAPTAV